MLDENSIYSKRTEELSLLNTVLLCTAKEMEEQDNVPDVAEEVLSESEAEMEIDVDNDAGTSSEEDDILYTRKTNSTMKIISGGDSLEYMEFNRGTSSGMERPSYFARHKDD